MKKALALILATAMACSLLLTGCGGGGAASGSGSAADGSAKQSLTLGTGGTTGTYYAVGGVMSTVLNDKAVPEQPDRDLYRRVQGQHPAHCRR